MKAVARFILIPLLLFSFSLSLLSPRVIGILGACLGDFLFALGFRKKIVTENLELALGGELSATERKSLARRNFRHVGTLFIEIARNFCVNQNQTRREVRMSEASLGRISAAMAGGKGAVFITGHIANWELFAMSTAAYGIPVSLVVKRMNNALSQVVIERQRLRTQIEIIYSGGAIEQMKKHLARGRGIGFMVDQNTTGKKGIRANFFGVPASSIRGLANMVKETGTAVVPLCSFRLPDGTHEAHVFEPLPYLEAPELPAGSPERIAREEWLNTQNYQAAIEKMVRLHPEQWLWIHRRWKTSRVPLVAETAHLENIT